MPGARTRALLFLAAFLIVANGYSGVVLWTLKAGTRTTAHIVRCEHGKTTRCYGTWRTGEGEVGDATAEGADVPVRLGPFGAYLDRPDVLPVRLIPGLVADVAVVLGFGLMLAQRRRSTSEAQELLHRPGAKLVLLVKPAGADHPDGRRYAVVRGDTVYDAGGAAVFVVDKSDSGHGEPHLGVLHRDGRPIGTVTRTHDGTTLGFALADADSRQLATVTGTGTSFTVTAGGAAVARLAWRGRGTWVLRHERPIGAPLDTLLLAYALDLSRLVTTRPLRRTTYAIGRGWAAGDGPE